MDINKMNDRIDLNDRLELAKQAITDLEKTVSLIRLGLYIAKVDGRLEMTDKFDDEFNTLTKQYVNRIKKIIKKYEK